MQLPTNRRDQLSQVGFLASIGLISWLGMMAVHESGHVLGALLTGGQVAKVVLDPRTISRTDLSTNPQPLLVAWAGPAWGCVLPLAVWSIAWWSKTKSAFLFRFFAGFCLLANGLYLACGSIWMIGDAGDLIRHGAPYWQLWIFGLLAAPLGLYLWHGLGPQFGLGKPSPDVDRRLKAGCAAVAVLLTIFCLWFAE